MCQEPLSSLCCTPPCRLLPAYRCCLPCPDSDELSQVPSVEASPSTGALDTSPSKGLCSCNYPLLSCIINFSLFASSLPSACKQALIPLTLKDKQTLLQSHSPSTDTFFLCSLSQKASETDYTTHLSLDRQLQSPGLCLPRALVKFPSASVSPHPCSMLAFLNHSAAFVTAGHLLFAMLSSFGFSWFSFTFDHFSWLLLPILTLPQVIFCCLLP